MKRSKFLKMHVCISVVAGIIGTTIGGGIPTTLSALMPFLVVLPLSMVLGYGLGLLWIALGTVVEEG